FQSMLALGQPSHGKGFSVNNAAFCRYRAVVDKENQTDAVPGESRIFIENESVRMAELDDRHLLTFGLKKGWTRAIRSITNGG
ncbi:MAG: hypothetical protein Q8R43_00755, partial [Alphaproteobacteria bacterium]|nr:hypothetical protein [Alphaproteobacteria bacterium]